MTESSDLFGSVGGDFSNAETSATARMTLLNAVGARQSGSWYDGGGTHNLD
jgi:hypothetical protein